MINVYKKLEEIRDNIDLFFEEVILPEEYKHKDMMANVLTLIERALVQPEDKATKILHRLEKMQENFKDMSKRMECLRSGMRVFVRQDLENNTIYGNDIFVPPMDNHKGELITLREIDVVNKKFRIHESPFNWTPEMMDWTKGIK